MGDKSAPTDAAIARIAAGQHGVACAAQLAEAGLGRNAIAKRVRAGRLHRVHRGVYAVGHPHLSQEGRWMAAVLACGAGAVLSHLSAAALWGLLRPEDGPIDISIPSHSGRRRREGIRVHRCTSLAADEGVHLLADTERVCPSPPVTVRHAIPVTSVARTIEDLRRGRYSERLVRRATRQAELGKYVLHPRTPRRRTRSDLEDDFLALCRRHRLPVPETNVKLGRWTVDFLWRAQRLVVETDAWATHRGSVAFEDDHVRDLDLRAAGFTVRRYTEAQIRDPPAQVVADLRAVLGGCS